jgi:hypothetical protein
MNNTKKINEIYRDFHVFMPRKPKVETRCEKFPAKVDEVYSLLKIIKKIMHNFWGREEGVWRRGNFIHLG